MRPDAAQTELSSAELAVALGEPLPTVKRWLRAWHALGVPGVRCVPSAGRYGCRYVCARDLPRRWRAGLLPSARLAA